MPRKWEYRFEFVPDYPPDEKKSKLFKELGEKGWRMHLIVPSYSDSWNRYWGGIWWEREIITKMNRNYSPR